MNAKKVSLINAAITGSIGFILFAMLFAFQEPVKLFMLVLFYPISYAITRFYIHTGVKNPFLAFLQGGIFSVIGTAIALAPTSTFGTFRFFDTSDGLIVIVWFITAIISFTAGGIAGILISHKMKNE
ncbi:MAG: hypothetical protein ACQESG_04095 [Nanobdellota archaeon]